MQKASFDCGFKANNLCLFVLNHQFTVKPHKSADFREKNTATNVRNYTTITINCFYNNNLLLIPGSSSYDDIFTTKNGHNRIS